MLSPIEKIMLEAGFGPLMTFDDYQQAVLFADAVAATVEHPIAKFKFVTKVLDDLKSWPPGSWPAPDWQAVDAAQQSLCGAVEIWDNYIQGAQS